MTEKKPKTSARHTVLIAANNASLRSALHAGIRAEPKLSICGEVETLPEARIQAAICVPEIIVAQVTVANRAVREAFTDFHSLQPSPKVLAITMGEDPDAAVKTLHAGADGLVSEKDEPGEIVAAILDLLAGHIYVSERVMGKTKRRRSPE
ncbi:MAG TPA: hypothetical protein VN673_18890 [Clostridia bacterium]|nr:hypothetical protein [Clostridia bacterium]